MEPVYRSRRPENQTSRYQVGREGVRKQEGAVGPSMLELMQRQQQIMQERNSRYFKRAVGHNRVRIMPSWRGPGHLWYIEVPTHENVGPPDRYGKTNFVTCQQFFDVDVCLVCLRIFALNASTDARDLNEAQMMRVKYGLFCNVARNEPDAIIKPWKITQGIFNYVTASFSDPSSFGENPLHSRTGRDLLFTYNPQGQGAMNMYPRIEFAHESTPIVIKDWAKKLTNLDTFWKPTAREDLSAMIKGEER